MVVRVEEVLCLLATRLAKVILVESRHFRIQVRHTESGLLVVGVETGRASSANFVGRKAGLTAATNATAAARHDFDEVVARLDSVLDVFANFIENLLDISHLVRDGDIDLRALDVDRCGLNAVHSANCAELDCRGLSLLGDKAVCCAKRSFHNTTRDTEDRASAGVGAEEIVSGFVRKRHEVDTGGLDHTSELARRQNNIGVLEARRGHILIAGNLELLSRAGHDRSDMDVLAVDAVLLCPVSLGECAEHLLRRLGGREVIGEVGSVLLHPVCPSGAAGGDERKLAARREALDELGAFFHDRDIGGEVGVEHLLEAEATECRVDLAGRKLARLHAERFAESDADCRSDLDDASLCLVAESCPNIGRLVVFIDCANGAVRRALTALDAGRLSELDICCRSHDRLFAASDELERPDVLHLLANFCTTSALDALVGIEDKRRSGGVVLAVKNFLRERNFADAEIGSDVLKFAVARARALQAVVRVVCEDKLEDGATNLNDVRVVREDLHSVDGFRAARSEELRAWHEFARLSAARNELSYDTDTAACAGLEVGVVAQCRYLNIGLHCGLEDIRALSDFDLCAVDFNLDHIHDLTIPFPLSRG